MHKFSLLTQTLITNDSKLEILAQKTPTPPTFFNITAYNLIATFIRSILRTQLFSDFYLYFF